MTKPPAEWREGLHEETMLAKIHEDSEGNILDEESEIVFAEDAIRITEKALSDQRKSDLEKILEGEGKYFDVKEDWTNEMFGPDVAKIHKAVPISHIKKVLSPPNTMSKEKAQFENLMADAADELLKCMDVMPKDMKEFKRWVRGVLYDMRDTANYQRGVDLLTLKEKINEILKRYVQDEKDSRFNKGYNAGRADSRTVIETTFKDFISEK